MIGQDATNAVSRHRPVMLGEVVEVLAPRDGGLYVDGTFGAGGYARAILEVATCSVVGIDCDPCAIAAGQALAVEFGDRLHLMQGLFSGMEDIVHGKGFAGADGVTFDFGVSSMQLDEVGRGFSFLRDGPLDMRMSNAGPTAADLVNTLSEAELARILFDYGEERRSRAIARAMVRQRGEKPLATTFDLVAVVESVLGRARSGERLHPATRTFQALRLAVNGELDEIEAGLAAAERLLVAGGRLAVVSFHSLEDRIVKRFLAARAGPGPNPSRHAPPAAAAPAASFIDLLKGGRVPGAAEVAANPRARSARLRAAERTAAPALAIPAGCGRRQC